MFGGKSERVTFEVASKLIDVIYDKFGEKVGITDLGNDKFKFTVDIQISDMFFGWCCSFGDKLKIIAPKEIKFQFSEYLNEIINNYIKE